MRTCHGIAAIVLLIPTLAEARAKAAAPAFVLVPDAPGDVRQWLADQPRLQAARNKTLTKEYKSAKARLCAMRDGNRTGFRALRTHQNGSWAFNFVDAADQQQALQAATAEMERVRAERAALSKTLLYKDVPVAPGAITLLSGFDVVRVIDAQTAVVRQTNFATDAGVPVGTAVCLRGVSTTGYVTGETVRLERPLAVWCDSTAGMDPATNVPMAKPFDPTQYVALRPGSDRPDSGATKNP